MEMYTLESNLRSSAPSITKRLKYRTLALIKPDAYNHIGKILDAIYKNGFTINRMKMLKMTVEMAQNFYAEHKGKSFFEDLINMMTSDVIIALELVADDAVKKWRTLIGPTNSEKARKEAPNTLRALYGTDGDKNAVHGSDSSKIR
jgi:nucleoside-diphosphate kinase